MYKSNSPIDETKHNWEFIAAKKRGEESLEEALSKEIEKEASIKIKEFEFLSHNFYHAKLTDDDVNHIKRREGQLLDFFNLKDLKNLQLDAVTKSFVSQLGTLI